VAPLEIQLNNKLEELRESEAELHERRYISQDITIEKLGELLRDNPQGILVLRDELAGWLRTIHKPGHEGDREFYLEGWNGDGEYTVDRIGRGTVHIPAVCISICGGIQPGKLQRYIAEALEEGEGADGLLQRLQLLIWPDGLGEWILPTHWPDREAANHAFDIFRKLDEATPAQIGADRDNYGDIPFIRFSPEAQKIFDDWRTRLENLLRSDDLADTPAFASHLGKYRSLIPALALLFHLMNAVSGSQPGPVPLETLELALDWGDFLLAHARKVYADELNPGVEGAKELGKRLMSGQVSDGQTVREIYRAQWSGLTTRRQVMTALDVLAQWGWARVESLETQGRPSEVIRVNPAIFSKMAEWGTDKTDRRPSVSFVSSPLRDFHKNGLCPGRHSPDQNRAADTEHETSGRMNQFSTAC
jgi:hypothetical protein